MVTWSELQDFTNWPHATVLCKRKRSEEADEEEGQSKRLRQVNSQDADVSSKRKRDLQDDGERQDQGKRSRMSATDKLMKEWAQHEQHLLRGLYDSDEEAAAAAPKILNRLVEKLTDEEKARVSKVLRRGQTGTASQYINATVDYRDIYTLNPGVWLNDEVINFYTTLLTERAENNQYLPRIHCFNTQFCTALRELGYKKIRRWTKNVDVFAKDYLLVPINREKHWTLGVVDVKKQEIMVYDSLNGNHDKTLKMLKEYLQQEHRDKKEVPLDDASAWKMVAPLDTPKQENYSDCGVFVCCFAECVSRRGDFGFSQENIEDVRKRIVLNILNKWL